VSEEGVGPALQLTKAGKEQKDAPFSIAFSAHTHFAVGLGGGGIRLWKTEIGVDKELKIAAAKKPLQTKVKKHIDTLFFDYEGQRLIAVPYGSNPELFSMEALGKGREIVLPQLMNKMPEIVGGMFSSDGRWIWLHSATRLFVFDAETLTLHRQYTRKTAESKFVTFDASRSGKYLSIGMTDGKVFVLRAAEPPEVLPE
jgi:hypothetical protein